MKARKASHDEISACGYCSSISREARVQVSLQQLILWTAECQVNRLRSMLNPPRPTHEVPNDLLCFHAEWFTGLRDALISGLNVSRTCLLEWFEPACGAATLIAIWYDRPMKKLNLLFYNNSPSDP